jgi:primosomal replication protein N
MYEGDDHTCSHVEESQLNEWANSPDGQTEEEQFTTDMEFMMNVISGGINGKKKDQTVMPGTKVTVSEGYTIDVAEEMRKLAGIK